MSILSPWFLLGGLAAAVPILLHLIRRERAKKLEFPSLMFLRRINKRTIRYQKLRHLLLLLMRILALLSLTMAFTRPYRPLPPPAADPGRETVAHVILLDNSLSMSYRDRWDRARSAAAAIARGAGPGDKLALVTFADQVQVRTPLTTDAAVVVHAIESESNLTDQQTRYSQGLKAVERVALDAGVRRRIIYLVSDFQKSGLMSEDQDFRLVRGIELQARDVGSAEFSNLAFGEVNLRESAAGDAAQLEIKASLINLGTEDRKNVTVRLIMAGRDISEKKVDVSAASSQAVEFALPGLSQGIHRIELAVDDPNLTRDNTFCLTASARSRTPVVSLENASGGRGNRSPSFFLLHALNSSGQSAYRLTPLAPKDLAIPTLGSRLLIWNNVGSVDRASQTRLQEFVSGGGGLVIAIGNAIAPADFNGFFGSWLPIRMASAGGPVSRKRPGEDYALLTDIRISHPIFKPFSEPHSGSFAGAKFFDHARLAPAEGAEVLARFDNGDPALVSAEHGKGRVLVYASSADDSWNDLPLKAVYAPFWHQALRYLENFQEKKYWISVGETISPQRLLAETALLEGKGETDADQAFVILDPDRERLPNTSGAERVALERAGFFEIRTANANATVAVNPVSRESDLTHANAEELVAGWTHPDAAAPEVLSDDEKVTPQDQEKQQRLWRFLLLGVLLFLVSEGFLGNQLVWKRE